MLNIPKDYIIKKIKEKTGLETEEINKKIEEKLKQLSGLISEEGAAHIIANELGIKLMEANDKLKIKNVFSGMRNVEIVGKVTKIYEVRHFQTGERSGKVGNFMIGDETGVMRIVCWGEKADILEKLSEGNTIKIKSAYSRDNNNRVELHLNENSEIIINPEGETIKEVKTGISANRKKIDQLTSEDSSVEILGTIVSAYDPRFFEVCPTCAKRVRMQESVFICPEHGPITTPQYSYVMNTIIDDGTENIRAIFFKNQMQHLTNMTHEEILELKDKSFEDVKNDLLGKIVKVIGRVVINDMFSRKEFIAQIVESNPNPDDEIKKLNEEAAKAEQESSAQNDTPAPDAASVEQQPAKMEQVDKDTNPEEAVSEKFEEKDAKESNEEKVSAEKEPVSIEDLEDDDIYE